jgi:flagellar motor switch protein FliN
MTDATSGIMPAEVMEYLKVWADSLSQVLSQVSGAEVVVQLDSVSEASAKSDTDLNFCAVLDGSLRGEMNFRIARDVALQWAQTFMAETADATKEFGPEYKEALEELLRQVAGQAATGLKSQFGQCQITVHASDSTSWSIAASSFLKAGGQWCAEAQVSAALLASIRPQTLNAQAKSEPVGSARNLDLLLDVELSLKLRFGERRMLLKEILDLNSGAIVELDRHIEEPVEVLLDDKIIARGEVVVVDGNYGVRLTEIAPSL